MKELYDRKLETVTQLHMELNSVLQYFRQQSTSGQIRQGSRKRETLNKRRLINTLTKKMERRRSTHSTTPTSPECSLTSPDSPQTVNHFCYKY